MTRSALHTFLYLIIACAIFAAALTALSMGVWNVLVARADADAARTKAAENAQQAVDMQAKATLAARTKLARANLMTLAIPFGGVAAYLSKLEGFARTEQVIMSVSSITATAPKADTPGVLALALQVSGDYAACMKFLQLIETQGVALAVSSVSLSYNATNERWQGSILFSALSFDKP